MDRFLLAKLHADSLSRKINRREVRAALKTLPSTLDATYADALKRMYGQDPDSARLAEQVLFWVISARRSLTIQDLQHLYATRGLQPEDSLEEDDLPDGDALTGVCSGLIIVDAESQAVRPVHYTAQQYFEKCHRPRILQAKLELTNISLAYMTLRNFASGHCTSDAAMALRLEQYPFLTYAAKYWGAELAELDLANVWENLRAFVWTGSSVEIAHQVWSLKDRQFTNWSQEFPRHVPGLVLASAFNLPHVLRDLVSHGLKINARGSDGETALIRSAEFGHTENVRVLLELGAEIDAQDHMDETALQRAARNGNEGVVRVLLDKGTDVNMKASSDWTALMSAVSSGNLEVVKMLVEAGVDLKAETVWGDSALSMATRSGQEAIANFLYDQGAVLPKGPAGRRASIIASRKGLHQLVRKLTANYDTVADKPLQRQSSRIMEGLSAIQEAEIATSDAQGEMPTSQPLSAADSGADSGADDFLDAMEEVHYSVGFTKRYDLCDRLGKGHYAEVFSCANRVTSVRYAVKVYTPRPEIELDTRRGIFLEFKVMQVLQKKPHRNILRVVDLFADYVPNKIYMVMELAPRGELFNYIVSRTCLPEDETRKIFSQLFSALEFLVSPCPLCTYQD